MIATQRATQTNPQSPFNAPSPVADGGGAERSEAEGVFVQKPHPQETPPDTPLPTLPEGKNMSRLTDAFLDGSFSVPDICDEFELGLDQVLALINSPVFQENLRVLKEIAKIREETIAAQARVVAINCLNQLANFADNETARKAAAQIIRTTNPKPRSATPRASRRGDVSTKHKHRPRFATTDLPSLSISRWSNQLQATYNHAHPTPEIPMPSMLVRNKVQDFDHWKRVFDEERASVQDSGMTVTKMWRSIDDPNEVFFILSISDMDKAKAFVASPASAATGERAGVINGELHYVEDV